jgi:hypothetical protein
MSWTTQLILAVDITDAGVYPTAAHPHMWG